MVAATAMQCILQGICLCASYSASKGGVCLGSQASYEQFGTATDYSTAIRPHLNETTVPIAVPEGCRPTLFYGFQRHSIRFPDGRHINASDELLPNIQEQLREKRDKSKLCPTDIDAILQWNNSFLLKNENLITESGRRATREQVQRLRQRFPAVFTGRECLHNVVVDFSEKGDRSRDTAEAFLREWFGDEKYEERIAPYLTVVNTLNNFHDKCEAIMAEHGINVTFPNKDSLMESDLAKANRKTLEKRLGFRIRKRELKAMLIQCRFGMNIDGSSPWCAVFGPEELKFSELLDDAEDYDEDVYGSPRNARMACPVAADLLSHLRSLNSTDEEVPRVVLHFSHAGAFKKLSAMFGLAHSAEPIRDCKDRAWHSARQAPFNANLNVVHYKCPAGVGDRVAVLLNEKLIQVPGCSNEVCCAQEFEAIMASKSENCDLQEICSRKTVV